MGRGGIPRVQGVWLGQVADGPGGCVRWFMVQVEGDSGGS